MSYPEPDDVGPAHGGHLPVSDADRSLVTTLLQAAYGEGRISADEHAERMQAARTAETFDDLVPLTRDLVALDQLTGSVENGAEPAEGPELIATIFGTTERRGRWSPRRNLSVLTLFGSTQLDLRDAVYSGNGCEINVFCLFGSVDVLVPEGVEARVSALPIFGSSQARTTAPAPGSPLVTIRGFVGFGSIDARAKRKKSA